MAMSSLIHRHLSTSSTKKTLVELFYDIVSPYTYFQFELLNRQRSQWKSMELTYTPVFISGLIRSSNNIPPISVIAKAQYHLKDLERLSKFYNVPMCLGDSIWDFIRQSKQLKLQRFLASICRSIPIESHEKLIRINFKNFFSPNRLDVSDVENIRKLAIEAGIEPSIVDETIANIDKPETKQFLKETTDRAIELGGFGLPLTLLHLQSGDEMVFGSDRLHIIGDLLNEKPPVLR